MPSALPTSSRRTPSRSLILHLRLLRRVRSGRRWTDQRHLQVRLQRHPRRSLLLPPLSFAERPRSTHQVQWTPARSEPLLSFSPPFISSISSAAPSAGPFSKTSSSTSSPTMAIAVPVHCYTAPRPQSPASLAPLLSPPISAPQPKPTSTASAARRLVS